MSLGTRATATDSPSFGEVTDAVTLISGDKRNAGLNVSNDGAPSRKVVTSADRPDTALFQVCLALFVRRLRSQAA